MTNKEKIIEQMRKYGIKKAVYTPELDFEAKHPCGDIVFAGEQNSEFTKPIWDLYDFSDVRMKIIDFVFGWHQKIHQALEVLSCIAARRY